MKNAVLLCLAMTSLALAAPALPDSSQEVPEADTFEHLAEGHREKRSHHYQLPPPAYPSPCAAASAPIPAIAPAYHVNVAPPRPSYGYHHSYGYGVPQYRSEDNAMAENEMMAFSDADAPLDHMSMSRYAYAPVIPHVPALPPLLPPPLVGPAYGTFPNANLGGCSVPLLFSCSPSITPGKIVKAQPHYGYAPPAPAPGPYRGVEDHLHQETHQEHPESQQHEQATTVHESARPAGSVMHSS